MDASTSTPATRPTLEAELQTEELNNIITDLYGLADMDTDPRLSMPPSEDAHKTAEAVLHGMIDSVVGTPAPDDRVDALSTPYDTAPESLSKEAAHHTLQAEGAVLCDEPEGDTASTLEALCASYAESFPMPSKRGTLL